MSVVIKQNEVKNENKPLLTKFVYFLVKIGIIPIFMSKDGGLTFSFFSWKSTVYVLFSVIIWVSYMFLFSLLNPQIYKTNNLSNSDVVLGFALKISLIFSIFFTIFPLLLSYGISKLKNGIFSLQLFGFPKKNIKERSHFL